jgi:predicted phage baseplate assembly protein
VRVAEGVRTLELKATGKPVERLHPGDELEVVGPVTANADGSATWTAARGTVTAPAGALEVIAPGPDAVIHSEVARVAGPTPDAPTITTLRLAKPLVGCYDRDAVRILANVSAATHGETRTQVLGSGNAATTYQRFALSQLPLTHVSAAGGTVDSTLQVRVDGRLWREVPQLFGSGPDDEVFATRMDDEGKVTVLFGDGRTGARLPTGTNNVTATYRIGTGLEGRVAADQLTLLMTRPLGLRSVTNPLASGLAADAEGAGDIRANAPRTALALGRVVSLRDVEDFARAVPGIGKSLATWLWNGQSRFVHLTVSGTGTQTVDTQAIKDLKIALLAAGDARLPLTVEQAEVVPVYVTVAAVVDPAYDATVVLEAVRASVTAALAVEARTLGQPLTNGDIIVAAHAVAGVVAVNVTLPKTDVPSARARMSGGQPRPAQLVVLAPGGLKVSEASP